MKLFSDKVLELMEKLGIKDKIVDLQNTKYSVKTPYYNVGGKLTNLVNFLADEVNNTNTLVTKLSSQFKPVMGFDNKAMSVLRWVHSNITYHSDQLNWKCSEYWARPAETLAKRSGDCEDGAILIFTLALHSGIPSNRIRIVAGDVLMPNGSKGGHCWVEYIADDLNEYILDWCYYFDNNVFFKRKTKDEMINYLTVWFKCSDKRGYGTIKYMSGKK